MQFFPAMGAGPGQSFSTGFRNEFQGATSVPDFSGFLSKEFEQPATEFSPQAEAAPLNESEASEARPWAWDEAAGVRQDRHDSSAADRPEPAPVETSGKTEHDRQGPGEPAAKAAGREHEEAGKGRSDAPASDAADVSGPKSASHGEAVKTVDADQQGEPQAAELKAEVAKVSREASGRAAANPEVAARIAALHDLMRQFQDSAPAERKELAIALGDSIKALREALAGSAVEARSAAEGSGKDGARRAREAVTAASAASAGKAVGESAAAVSSRMPAGDAAAAAEEVGRKASAVSEGAKERNAKAAGERLPRTDADGKPGPSVRETEGGSRALATATSGERAMDAGTAGRSDASGVRLSGDKAPNFIEAKSASHGEDSGAREAASAKTPETVKRSTAAGQAGVAASAEGKARDVRPDQAQSRQDKAVREGDNAEAADQTARESARQSEKDVALKTKQDTAPREAAKNGAAAAGLPDRGQKVREKAEPQGQTLQADSSQDGGGRYRESSVTAEAGGERQRQDARNGFFGPSAEKKAAPSKPGPGVSAKVVSEAEPQFQGAGLNSQPTITGSRPEATVSARSAEVYRQVESGAFRNLGQGVRQLVLHLDPADLGQVSVILRVKGKEVQAVLRASSQETSQVLGEQMAQLRTQLESQGLKVGKLEVQTQMADSQEQSQWQGAEQHNRYQENRELALSAQRWRTMELVDGGLVRDVQNTPQREKLSSSGLDIFA